MKLLDNGTNEVAIAAPVVEVVESVAPAVITDGSTNIFKTDEIEIPVEETIEEDNLISEAQSESEEMDAEAQSIESEILETQEVSFKTAESAIESTDEINLLNMFELNEEIDSKEMIKEVSYSVDDLLNLFVQPNKELTGQIKEKWSAIDKYSTSTEFGTFATLLESTRITMAGETFILIMSQDENVVKEINSQREEVNFVEFINEVLGNYYLTFAITKDEFEKVKEAWQQASTIGKLPVPKKVERPTGKPREENKAEELGNELFGELFKA